jgi:hypothetical protein
MKEQVKRPLRHVDDLLDFLAKGIIAPQKACLVREVLFNRLLNAIVKKLRVRRRVEVPVEISGVIQNADVELWC